MGWNEPSLIAFCVAPFARFITSCSGTSSSRVMFMAAFFAFLAASLSIFLPATVAP